ncbi:phage head spike fiber domain-containing protein [Aeromonas veronii]
MAGLWQRTGNVTVTNGSRTVTGFGTKWKTGTLPIQKGHAFYGPDGVANEVDTVVSDTEILLVEAYRGGTLANQPYKIDITRTSTISQFSAELSALVGKYRTWFDSMMTWLTGSGDVGILNPDTGATVTIPSWKKVASEGEGQAARAKVEADRSKIEADRSGTEADRAAGIVAAAALPLPDVWAPLTDSLRLFTGYGREVKVGEDVVARMVNFSRNSTKTYRAKDGTLKVAAVNEPAFEAEGLLLEGQSTNLVPNSKNPPPTSGETSVTPVASPYGDVFKFAAATTNNSMKDVRFAPLTAGQLVTLSFIAKKAEIDTVAVGFDGMFAALFNLTSVSVGGVPSGSSATITPIGDGFYRVTLTTTTTRDVIPSLRLKVNGTFVANAVGDGMLIGNLQAQLLPFAGAYIQTTGTAVTCAADVATLPQSLNLGESQLGFSLAVEFDSVNTGLYRVLELSDQSAIILEGATMTVRHAGKEVHSINAPLGQRHHLAYSVATDGTITVALNGKLLAPQSRSVSHPSSKSTIALGNRIAASDRAIYGHLRDLKIWTKKPLTADQLKVASA